MDADSSNIEFKLENDGEIPASMTADKHRVQAVLRHYLSNAFKFTKIGKITVIVFYDLAEKICKISVKDTGIGIAPQHRSRLFKQFSPIKRTQVPKTGLG